jgi:hypothetical protein
MNKELPGRGLTEVEKHWFIVAVTNAQLDTILHFVLRISTKYEGNSISKLQIQVATYVF